MTDHSVDISPGGLDHPEVQALLREHLSAMAELSPPESCHALDGSGLDQPGIFFWSAWVDGRLAGCGALKELDARHGEIKSMRTAKAFLRKGIAARLLETILMEAAARGYRRLSLETGSMPAFEPARRLYARYGFVACAPFADYVPDPNSTFMTLDLSPRRGNPEAPGF